MTFATSLDNGQLAKLREKAPWSVHFGLHEVSLEQTPADAVKTALHFTGWERNVRIISPNGMRLSVQAASLLL